MCLPIAAKPEAEFIADGLRCAVVVHPLLYHRCGYVRIPPEHPLYRASKEKIRTALRVHGSVNFIRKEDCTHEDGRGLWIGFDCGHAFDFSPGLIATILTTNYYPHGEVAKHDHNAIESNLKLVREIYDAGTFEHSGKLPPFDEDRCRALLTSHHFEHYWTKDEVIRETMGLATQVAQLAHRRIRKHGR